MDRPDIFPFSAQGTKNQYLNRDISGIAPSNSSISSVPILNSQHGVDSEQEWYSWYQNLSTVDDLKEIITRKGDEIRALKAQVPKPSKEILKPHVDQLLFLKERYY